MPGQESLEGGTAQGSSQCGCFLAVYAPEGHRLSKDVQVYCKACHICATRKTAEPHQKVGLPKEEAAIDLIGPLPESTRGTSISL